MPPIASSIFTPVASYPQEERAKRSAWRLQAWLLGTLVGAALQLQQPVLWSWPVYGVLLAMGGVAWLASGWCRAWAGQRSLAAGVRWRHVAALGFAASAGALALFALCGLRAGAYTSHALSPGLEGRDLRVTGVVVAMLAGLHPLGVILASIFVAGMLVGADSMSRAIAVPNYIADVIVATSLLAMLVATLFAQYRLRRNRA